MAPGYLEAAGTRLLRGRDVSWHDTADMPPVAVVNDTFARRMWGEAPEIGQRFLMGGRLREVVGVVETGKYHDLAEPAQPAVFLPFAQSLGSDVVLVVRSALPPDELAPALRRTLSGIEPNVPVTLRTWPDALGAVLFPARAAAAALGVMGLLAAMLAVTGIFGMAAYIVSRRKKELGIRAALGACRAHVMGAALGRPLALLGIGSAAGVLGGLLATRLLATIVYEADPAHPAVLAAVVLAMVGLGAAGSAVPAWRALAVDPATLMREE
jgi:hypothetical protein